MEGIEAHALSLTSSAFWSTSKRGQARLSAPFPPTAHRLPPRRRNGGKPDGANTRLTGGNGEDAWIVSAASASFAIWL